MDRFCLGSCKRDMVQHGWVRTDDADLASFQRRKDELSTQEGCVLCGSRVVIPSQGRARVLEELHESHPGITQMKSLARSTVWWPRIDEDLEKKVRGCTACQENQNLHPPAPLHPWEWPACPWARVHIDYAGPFLGRMFLVVVDAYSKWLDVRTVPAATSNNTMKVLRSIFATHGLPEMIVSDNGSTFTSQEFRMFLKQNGVRHICSAPYHPASNGLVERAVQTLKRAMKKSATGDIETRLSRFLFHYRSTPHSTTGQTPAELLMGRRMRTQLDFMKPNLASHVRSNQGRQKAAHDTHSRERMFDPEQTVFVRECPNSAKWLPGTVVVSSGPVSYKVQLQDGRILHRHVDHIRARHGEGMSVNEQADSDTLPPPAPAEVLQDLTVDEPVAAVAQPPVPIDVPAAAPEPAPRRSARIHRPPDRLIYGL